VRFNHTDSWKNLVIGNEYEPYSIYLTAGKHVITMENVIGDMSTTMETLQTVITNLNEMYLDVVMITSSDPDPYRDYYVERQLPGLSGQFLENAELLFQVADYMIEVVGGKGSETAFFEDIAYNLESYADDVESLTYKGRIEFFKNDINSLSSKLTQYQNQALDIDYIVLLSTDMEMPRAKENLWEWMSFQAGTFIASFSKQEKKFQDEDKVIKVWFNTGNDQYEILQSMITDIFTPMTGIEVDLELVQGTLIEATVAGNGPDVALGIDASTVVNLALRGALEELDGYDGFDQLIDQYIEGADIPFTLENRTYGIPNSSAFSVMFVRTDIFEQLGLEVPTTWDEMYDVTQVLQRNNMTLATVPGFATLLYQKGGSYYNEEKTKVLFDENVAVEAFTQYTEFYTKYDFPVTFDFLSRFRTGEMPIGIASYATYNSLKYSAPEINGLWEMYPIPGTVRADGSVDYTQAVSGGIGCVMFSHSDNTDAAWEFIKWWSSAETQQRYANDLEAVMGYAARYDTTNLQTLDNIGWTNRELKVLKEQLQYLEYIPIVPGDYYVTRGIDNTYRGVINDGANVRELLTNWTVKINEEIERKRKEFYENN